MAPVISWPAIIWWDLWEKGDEKRQKPDTFVATIEAPSADAAVAIANEGLMVDGRRYLITIGERHWIEKRKMEVARCEPSRSES